VYAQLLTFGAAFLGSAVESVEALTIVLAVGLTRGWRSPLYGAVVALVALAVLVLIFGQLIVTRVPELTLKLIIGTLIVLFGLRWLHKAILRSAGVIAMHDENKSYEDTVNELHGSLLRQDWVAFIIALKGVFLEGMEVVFIVVAVGGTSGSGGLPIAVAGGLLAMVVIAVIGVVVRRPLAQVPENTLKYAVGVILASIGTFWVAEGMGATWPLDLVSVLGIAAIYFGASRVAVMLIRGRKPVMA
jgi:Ca2+/H+ antiporter, TMEM165/GDT1 family